MLSAQGMSLAGRLHRVSLELEPGRITAICGPNGAGKSSLLAALAGILPTDAGSVWLDGSDLATMPARQRARAIGYLPQGGEVAWDITVATLVELGRMPWRGGVGHRAHASGQEDAAAVRDALAAMELEALAGRRVSRLSGGERARALLGRVLAGQPRWVLADEPLAALDLGHAEGLMRRLAALARNGAGVAVVLHDLPQAMNHADRVVVLEKGRVVSDGPPEQALGAAVIRQVWGVEARWLGEVGARALAFGA